MPEQFAVMAEEGTVDGRGGQEAHQLHPHQWPTLLEGRAEACRLAEVQQELQAEMANYLRPDLKRGLLLESEEKMVIDLHYQLGNKWSKIATHLPGRTDNEIKNHWNTHIKKKLKKIGIDPQTHKPIFLTSSDEQEHSFQPPRPQEPAAAATSKRDEQAATKALVQEQSKTSNNNNISSSNITATTVVQFDPTEGDIAFCTDEVPMIQPHEILVPSGSAGPSTSSSSITTSITSSSSKSSPAVTAEEIQLPCMEWQELVYLWGLDDIMNWDPSSLWFDDADGKLEHDHFTNQIQRTVFYHVACKFELF